MFGPHASRLARIDWPKYGLSELNGVVDGQATPEQLQRAVVGLATGVRQLAEELASVLGNRDFVLPHSGPVILSGYDSGAPTLSPDETDLELYRPRLGAYGHDSYWDNTNEVAQGGVAGVGRGVFFWQPAVNNPVVAAGGAINKIVHVGGLGAGIRWDNIFVENIYNHDGTVWSAFPAGSVMLWAGAVGSIPSGWAQMNGTDNSVGNGGSGIDMRGMVPYGYSGAGDFATVGASIAASLTVAFAGTGNVTTSSNGAHVHNIEHESIAAAITVTTAALSHSASSGGSLVSTETFTQEFAVFSANVGDSAPTSATSVVTEVGGATSGSGVTDASTANIAKSTIAGALADHAGGAATIAAVETPSTFDTSSDGAHTHTASISTIADGLSFSSVTTVRPAGKVLVYIEKLAA